MIRPVKTYTRISTGFGAHPYPYNSFNKHLGIDYQRPEGGDVLAPVSGTVTMSYLSKLIGNCIEIRENGNGRLHRVMHLKSRLVKVGAKVKEGQKIATSGGAKGKAYSGTASTGPHLHWDVRKAGTTYNRSFSNYYDPEKLLKPAPKPAPKPPKFYLIQLKGSKSDNYNVHTSPSLSAPTRTRKTWYGKTVPNYAHGGQKYTATIDKNGWARIYFDKSWGYVHPSTYKKV